MKQSLVAASNIAANIMLVDDNRNGLIVRKAVLEECGFSVETASDAEQALALLEAAHYDVVVTDYKMPGMNGAELIRVIRQHYPAAGIVLLSGFVEPLGLTEQGTGADIVLSKSANEATQLLRAVKRLSARATPRKSAASQTARSQMPAKACS